MSFSAKKIFIVSSFIFFTGYTLLSGFHKIVNTYDFFQLPDRIFLKTPSSVYPFNKSTNTIYCLTNATCGYIKNKTKNEFDFILTDLISTHFYTTANNTFKTAQVYYPEIVQNFSKALIEFQYKNNNQHSLINCPNVGVCSKNNKPSDFTLIAGGLILKKISPFEKSYSINNVSTLIFKDNKNKYFTLRKNDNGHFEKVETNKKSLFRKHKFLLLLSSYKRPIYLLNQIHRMDNQNYNKSDFDISISSKGVSDEITKYIILPSIQNLIHEKQVFFRNDKNSNQFANLLNTYRDMDISSYDYLCKIDDDDWYHKDYLKNLNFILQGLNNPEFIVSNSLTRLDKNYLKTKNTPNMGSTICFNRNFAKFLLLIEKMDDSEIQKIIPPNTNLKKPYLTNFEDHLINALAHYRGNKAIYFPPVPMFIYNQSTASITRFK